MEKIQAGDRPFIIIVMANLYQMEASVETEYSANFILDGHHKLEAYIKLNINPPCLFITREFTSVEKPEFDVESLGSLLYPWQISHILWMTTVYKSDCIALCISVCHFPPLLYLFIMLIVISR